MKLTPVANQICGDPRNEMSRLVHKSTNITNLYTRVHNDILIPIAIMILIMPDIIKQDIK